ncbi:helix-turn-helix domain-containing protein [Stieleria varia]|uniref:helix-turn-helix domain-containing protein n=1 Tax=Stieleria varia TaxID=2528005 RepID=UPI0011B4937B|nr:helix-turn-helix domain-containing protein [Stieleria varia]
MSVSRSQFSPKQVATALAVSESSVKRWCDQGVIPTVRTVGGHRRITVDGLNEFLASTSRKLVNSDALGMVKQRADRKAGEIPGGQLPDQRAFRVALANGDQETCSQLLQARVEQGWMRSEAAEDLIADALRGLGEAWNCGELEVYQERRGCEICMRLLEHQSQMLPAPRDDAPVAIGCAPETDPYQIPTKLAELALKEVGYRAVSLGNNLPITSLIQAAADYQPRLVWLSVTTVSDVNRFILDENRLAESLSSDVLLLVGGQALTDELRPKLRYTAHCDTLRHLIELAGVFRKS